MISIYSLSANSGAQVALIPKNQARSIEIKLEPEPSSFWRNQMPQAMRDLQSFVFKSSSSTTSASSSTRRRKLNKRRGAASNSSSSIIVTDKTFQFPNLAANPNATLPGPENMVQVESSGKAEDLENVNELKQQTTKNDNALSLQTGTIVPDPVQMKTKEKLEENFDAPSNVPLPLIPIWRILKGIPQIPHFFQLRMYSELAREKLVAAWDQAFEDTVEQILDLKTKDFWVSASKLWKTMEDLQGMGYNVVPIRRRLVEMAEVMNELKQSKLEIVTLKNQTEIHRMRRSMLESVILSLQQRAEREGMNMVRLLDEIDQMEKKLPKYDGLIANLVVKPFGVNV